MLRGWSCHQRIDQQQASQDGRGHGDSLSSQGQGERRHVPEAKSKSQHKILQQAMQ